MRAVNVAKMMRASATLLLSLKRGFYLTPFRQADAEVMVHDPGASAFLSVYLLFLSVRPRPRGLKVSRRGNLSLGL